MDVLSDKLRKLPKEWPVHGYEGDTPREELNLYSNQQKNKKNQNKTKTKQKKFCQIKNCLYED